MTQAAINAVKHEEDPTLEPESFHMKVAHPGPEEKHFDIHAAIAAGAQTFVPITAIRRIDDALIDGFNREKFDSIRFTADKKISLFFEHTVPLFVQSIFVPIFHIIYSCFFKIEITGKENLKNLKGPTLFISNHIGFYDSFVFDLFVKPFSPILPFRFMGAKVFLSPFLSFLKLIGVVDLIYLFFGVFKITKGEGAEKSLKKAYEIIKNGGTVAMFPEGRIWKPTMVHPEAIGPFKWGAAILAKNTGVQVVPVAFKETDNQYTFRDKLNVVIGEPFFVDNNKAPEVIAEEMRKIIARQFDSIS